MRSRKLLSLLAARSGTRDIQGFHHWRPAAVMSMACLLLSCGLGYQAPPELPASVSPDWTRKQVEQLSTPPAQVSKDGSPQCSRTDYTGPGEAHVWTCRYAAESNAFEAVQRTRAEANTVKFQEGSTFVLVQWDKATRDEITTLIRGVQKALNPGPKK